MPSPFDFRSNLADPYGRFAELRQQGAVVPANLPLLGRAIALPRYAECVAALKDDRLVRFPKMRLAVPASAVAFNRNAILRGLRSMPVELHG